MANNTVRILSPYLGEEDPLYFPDIVCEHIIEDVHASPFHIRISMECCIGGQQSVAQMGPKGA